METALNPEPTSEFHRRSLFTVIGLMGTVVLMPVQMINLPLQMDVVDVWMLAVLIIFWSGFMFGRQTLIRLSPTYLVAMWLILVACVASTFTAVDHFGSGVVVVKEVYLFAGFITLATLLSRLSPRNFRFVMSIWLATVVLHGMLIVAEFLFPELFRFISGSAGYSVNYETYRPSGLYISSKAGNANKAAVFQLLGYVPLVLARPSRRIATVLGILLLLSILATGSMGTTLAFLVGAVTAVIAIAATGKHVALMARVAVRSMIAVAVLGGILLLVVRDNPVYQDRFESIIVGRAEKSSGGRFALWQRGLETLQESENPLFGIGPENFRDIDVLEKQLHNDLLAFSVERGLFGVLGLVLFAGAAISRSVLLLQIGCKYPQQVGLSTVVFLGVFAAVLFVSQTHQVFHAREIWMVLATQEAMLAHHQRVPVIASQKSRLMHSSECWSGT